MDVAYAPEEFGAGFGELVEGVVDYVEEEGAGDVEVEGGYYEDWDGGGGECSEHG